MAAASRGRADAVRSLLERILGARDSLVGCDRDAILQFLQHEAASTYCRFTLGEEAKGTNMGMMPEDLLGLNRSNRQTKKLVEGNLPILLLLLLSGAPHPRHFGSPLPTASATAVRKKTPPLLSPCGCHCCLLLLSNSNLQTQKIQKARCSCILGAVKRSSLSPVMHARRGQVSSFCFRSMNLLATRLEIIFTHARWTVATEGRGRCGESIP